MYQANYGFNAAGEPDPNVNVQTAPAEEACKEEEKMKVEADDEKGKKRKLEEPKWFDADPKNDNNVYVAGLPLTTTEEEFVELMSKYGIIMADDQGKPLLSVLVLCGVKAVESLFIFFICFLIF